VGGAGRRPRHAAPRRRWSCIERDVRRCGVELIAGVDEVGRGSLAGPVVACAVIMPPAPRAMPGVDDSKALTARARVRLARRIQERALALSLGAASAREIDRFNIYHASVLAMRRALSRLSIAPQHVLIDGRPLRTLGVEHTAVIDGDDRCFSIACASIVAKVVRDRLMSRLAPRYAEFHWERNCGYATRDHLLGLAARGPSPHHRRSFLVKERFLALLADAPQLHETILEELPLQEITLDRETARVAMASLADAPPDTDPMPAPAASHPPDRPPDEASA
jgi:ribonuclease HII